MIRILVWFLKISAYLALVVALSCAQPASPTGGERDKEPPTVVKTEPANQTLNFDGHEVKIVFSEAVRAPTFDKEIFISPFMKKPKILRSDNARRITIKFTEELRPQTTYVITLTDIKDNTESNPIEETFTLAFSTGDVLDSMELSGKVFAPVEGKTVKDMTLMLFDADSIKNNDFKGKRPAYITKSDESGEFEFKYLRNTRFKIYGVIDTDQSNSYSQDAETVAVSPDSLIVFPDDSTNLATVTLYSFLPDTMPPRLMNYAWWTGNTISCRFNENLRLDSMSIVMTDTLNQDSVVLDEFTWYGGTDKEMAIHTSRDINQWSHIHFRNVSDSLGNRMDTVLRVNGNRRKTQTNPLLAKPELDLKKEAWNMFSHRLFTLADSSMIFLTDTSRYDSLRKSFPLTYNREGFRLLLKPRGKPDPKAPYILNIKGDYLRSFDTLEVDTVFRYQIKWFTKEDYGTIKGVVKYDSTYSGPIVLQFLGKSGAIVRTTQDTTFAFYNLPPESYTVRIILDEDGNGVWTPGNLWPFRLPEKIYEDATPIAIRANWDFEDHIVQIGAKSAAPVAENEAGTSESDAPANLPGARPGARPGGGPPARRN